MDGNQTNSSNTSFALVLVFILTSIYAGLVYFFPEQFSNLFILVVPIIGFVTLGFGFFYGLAMLFLLYIVNAIFGMYYENIEMLFDTTHWGILSASILSFLVGLLFFAKDEHDIDIIDEKDKEIQALENEINEIIATDELTGLFKSELLHKVGEREWQRNKRVKLPISVIYCSIDNFKLYNLNHGKEHADRAMVHIASVLKQSVKRPSDFSVRFDGDAFMILLPDTDLFGSSKVAKIIKDNMIQKHIEFEGVASNKMTLSIAVVAAIPDDTIEFGHLLEVAVSICNKVKSIGGDDIIAEQL